MPTESIDDDTAGEAQAPPADRRRVLLALGALLCFGAIVAVVLATTGGDGSSSAAPAPNECVEAWNSDEAAIAFSRHNAIAHFYDSAQVGYITLSAEASVSDDPASGDCVVIFARTSLDPEPIAAGQILQGKTWTPLNQVTDINTVARLQSEAFEGANAEPTTEGDIVPAQDS